MIDLSGCIPSFVIHQTCKKLQCNMDPMLDARIDIIIFEMFLRRKNMNFMSCRKSMAPRRESS